MTPDGAQLKGRLQQLGRLRVFPNGAKGKVLDTSAAAGAIFVASLSLVGKRKTPIE